MNYRLIRSGLALALLLTVCITQAPADADSEGRDFEYAGKLYHDHLYDVAAQQYGEFIRRYPTSPRVPEAYFMQGECNFQEGDFLTARRLYQRVVLEYPASRRVADAQLKTGDCYRREGNAPAALENYLRVADLAPSSALAPLGLLQAARLSLELGNTDRAAGLAERLLLSYQASPHYFSALLLQGDICIVRGDLAGAELALSRIPLAEAGEELALRTAVKLAQVQFKRGWFETGVALLEERLRAEQSETRRHALRYELSRLLLSIGDYDAARASLGDDFAKPSAAWLELLGDLHWFRDHPDSALTAWGRIADPDVIQCFKLAWAADREGELDGARRAAFKLYNTADSTQQQFSRWALRWFLEHPEHAAGLDLPRLVRELTETEPAWALTLLRYYRQTQQWSQADYLVARLQPGQSPQADDLALEIIRLRTAAGQYEMADRLCASFLRNYPASPLLPEVERLRRTGIVPKVKTVELLPRLTALLLAGGEDDRRQYAELGLIYAEELYDDAQALPLLEKAVANGGDTPEFLAAEYHRLRILSARGGVEPAQLQGLLERGLPAPWRRQAVRLLADLMARSAADSLACHLQTAALLEQYADADPQLLREAAAAGLAAARLDPDPDCAAVTARHALNLTDSSATADAATLLLRGELAELSPDWEAAADSYRRLLADYPATGEAATALLRMFYLPDLTEAERLEAAQRFRIEFWYHPTAPELETELVRLHAAAGRYHEALACYLAINRCLEAERIPVNIVPAAAPANEYEIGRLYLLLEQPEEALPHFLRFLEAGARGSRYLDALFKIGQVYAELGDYPRAAAYWSYLLKNHPEDPGTLQAMRRLAFLQFDREQPAAARELFLRLVELQPDHAAEYRFFVILADVRSGELERAKSTIDPYLRRFKAVIDKDTCITRYRWEKGRRLLKEQNWDEARTLLEKTLKVKGTTRYHPEARYELARLQAMLGNEETAIQQLQQLRDQTPAGQLRGNVQLTLGTLYSRTGNLEQAVLAFRGALADLPAGEGRLAALSNLIAAYKLMSLPEAAIPLLEELLELSTDPEELMQRRIELGNLYRNSGNLDQALSWFRTLLQTADREDSAAIQYYIGQCYYDRGDYETAITEFLKVTYFDYHSELEWEITAIYQAAQAYEQLGHPERARDLYQRIIADRGLKSTFGRSAAERLRQLESLERE